GSRNETKKLYGDSNLKLKFIPKTFFSSFSTLLNLPGRYFLYIIDRLIFSFFAFVYLLCSDSGVVFTKDPVIAFFLVISKRLHKRRVMYEIHKLEHIQFEKANPFVRMLLKGMEIKALKGSDHLIAISVWLKEYVERFGRGVLFLPDGFDDEIFKPQDRDFSRKKLGIPKESKIVMYSGASFRHGVENLVLSMRSFKKDKNVKLYLLGGLTKEIAKLKKVSEQSNLGDVIIFVGNVPHGRVPDYLNASDVLVLPYSREKFTEYFSSPLKLFEYMAVKKPIIATKVGCFEGILKNGENAILVEPDDPEALAEGIKRIFNTKKLARRIAEKAYKDSKKFTYRKRAEKIGDLL
ncbi:MAG: glycosyltransferase family 4 protein, partial [Candidatus Syntropharchaeia archaeon]